DRLDMAELRALAASSEEDLLEGTEADRSAEFGQWLAGRRTEMRSHHVDVVAETARRSPPGTPEGVSAARDWIEHAPLDARAHGRFLAELAQHGLLDDCARHVDQTARLFAAEGV